jgi:hypothetical protein
VYVFLLVPSLCPSTDVSIDEQQVIYYPPSTDISMSITTEHSDAIDVNIISHNNLQSKDEQENGLSTEDGNMIDVIFKHTFLFLFLGELQSTINNLTFDSNRRCKQTHTTSLTRKKKLRSDSIDNQTNIVDENANDIHTHEVDIENNTIDYLSLEPERIVSITRSRTSIQDLEFLLKCSRCPTKLFFISNEKAKELVPDLLIDFYEKHINWFIDRTSSRQKIQRRIC